MTRLVAAALHGMTAFCIAVLVGACASAALPGPDAMSRSSYFFGNPLQADFVQAVGRGDLRRANALIDAGAAVDAVGKDGMTPVFWALSKQNLEGLRFLLRSGADPNRVTTWTTKSGREQAASAIHLAAIMEDRSYLAALLDHGGNADLVENELRQTPIYEAILHGRNANAALLLAHGANINHRDSASKTPINYAVSMNHYAQALYLLKQGADATIENRWGYSAVGTTKMFGSLGVARAAEDEAAYPVFVDELKTRGLW